MQILQNIQEDLQRSKIEPEEFGDRIIFISMFNDIDWTVKETKGIVFQIHTRSRRMHKDSRKDVGRSLALESESKRYENRNNKRDGKCDSIAAQMVQRFRETGHPVLTGARALSLGFLERSKGKETTILNADRIIYSVTQQKNFLRSGLKLVC